MNSEGTREALILFLILPNSNLLDLAGATQVFHEAIDHGLNARIRFCAYEDEIKTSVNLPFGKIDSYKEHCVLPGDFIFIVSADMKFVLSGKLNPGKALLDWLTAAHGAGVNICAICNGAFLLGETGLLDNRECTTHWKRIPEFRQRFPLAKVQENILFIETEGIITSAGAASGIDVALYVLGKLKDDHFVYKVSRDLVIYNRRSGTHHQQSAFTDHRNHMHAGIHRVQDWIADNLDKKANIAGLAEIALMSERNFTRVFKKETLLTINEYTTLLRVEKIKGLLKNPDLSRQQIARFCGLQSVKQINRLISKI